MWHRFIAGLGGMALVPKRVCSKFRGNKLASRPFVYTENGVANLHFEIGTVQSSMYVGDPNKLALGYTRTMAGCLLFNPTPTHIAMIGLGGGSLAKYFHRHLPLADIVVAEINPHVIALRDEFAVPQDSERFRIVCADGAQFVTTQTHALSVLMVDGFDLDGQAPSLCTQRFYDDCHQALDEQGILVVNLYGADAELDTYLARIRRSFDHALIVLRSDDCANQIVFAAKGNVLQAPEKRLQQHARELERLHTLGFQPLVTRIVNSRRQEFTHDE